MAKLLTPLTDEEVKKIPVGELRKEYTKLSEFYNRIVNEELVFCPQCQTWKAVSNFYASKSSPDGIEHFACRECILDMCTDYDKKSKTRVDNKDKTIATFRKLDWYFDEKVYNDQVKIISEGVGEKVRNTAAQQWIVMCRSLPQYSEDNWSHSKFVSEEYGTDENTKIVQKTLKAAKKRFGTAYSNEDLMFLENEYQDWITRYECNTKAQESIFERLSFKKWEINKATKNGAPTKDLDKTYQELLSTANITPRQAGSDNFTDAQTFGTLIQKYEETRPLPEIDPELEDVDKIGLYIDVFYKGHASKMLGLKNNFSHIYEKFMSKFTVTKPTYDDDEDSEDIFNRVFGSIEDGD